MITTRQHIISWGIALTIGMVIGWIALIIDGNNMREKADFEYERTMECVTLIQVANSICEQRNGFLVQERYKTSICYNAKQEILSVVDTCWEEK